MPPVRCFSLLLALFFSASCAQTSFAENSKKSGKEKVPPVKERTSPVKKSNDSETKGSLGLEELTRLAIERSPEIKKAESDLRVAQAKRNVIRLFKNPEVRPSYSWDNPQQNSLSGDRLREERSYGARIRLFPPNPWEMKTELRKIAQEESFADHFLTLLARQVAMEVRELYVHAQFMDEQVRIIDGAVQLDTRELDRLSKLLADGSIRRDAVDQQRIKATNKRGNGLVIASKINQAKAKLAAYVGLEDPRRIAVQGVPIAPLLDFHTDSAEVLASMAFLNNLEIAKISYGEALAQGKLQTLKAKKIPWFSFVEVGQSSDYRKSDKGGTSRVNDNYGINLAIEVPIFTWLGKESRIYEEEIRGARAQVALYRERLLRQVRSAIANVRAASSSLADYDRDTVQITKELEEATASGLAERVFEKDEALLNRRKERVEVEEGYYLAVLELEKIIGSDIRSAFRQAEEQPKEEKAKP